MSARLRTTLAALGLVPGRVVSAQTLAEVLWDDNAPGGAAVTVRNYVKRLRQALGPDASGAPSTAGTGLPAGRGRGRGGRARVPKFVRPGRRRGPRG